MFADPLTITINAVPLTLNRTAMGTNSGAFMTADGLHRLSIAHSVIQGANQRVIKLERVQTVTNPLTVGSSLNVQDAFWCVSRTPQNGLLTVTSEKQLIDGFQTALNASSGAWITKLLGGES